MIQYGPPLLCNLFYYYKKKEEKESYWKGRQNLYRGDMKSAMQQASKSEKEKTHKLVSFLTTSWLVATKVIMFCVIMLVSFTFGLWF